MAKTQGKARITERHWRKKNEDKNPKNCIQGDSEGKRMKTVTGLLQSHPRIIERHYRKKNEDKKTKKPNNYILK